MSNGGTREKPANVEPLAVVGIGASAGGLEALRAFLAAVPPQSGLAIVVVTHLDPAHDSLMPERLAKSTALPVAAARDRQPLLPDHVYVIPPNRTLTIEKGHLRVEEVEDRRALHGMIDRFFRSLAADQGPRASAIVLSGAGTDGALGARAVKAAGGLVMVQRPHTAAQSGMPASAIATGVVDLVLEPGEMPGALRTYVRSRHSDPVAALRTVNAQLQEKVQELTMVNDDLANLLTSTDIATVFLDPELRIKRSTAAGSHVFHLQPSDTGRPIHQIASMLIDVDLSGIARTVLHSATPIEREVTTQTGRHYILRARPYLTGGTTAQGVVLTLVDVSLLKVTERAFRMAREQISGDLRRMTRLHEATMRLGGPGDLGTALQEILRAAVEITDAEMGCIQRFDETEVVTIAAQIGFDRPFLDFFARAGTNVDSASRTAMANHERVVVESLADSPIFEGSPSLAVLLQAGVRAMQATPLFDRSGAFLGTLSTHYRVPHQFDHTERRWLDLLARPAGDIIHRRQTEALLTVATGALEQRVADRTKWLTLMHNVTHAINDAATWHDGLRLAMRWICESEDWQLGYVYLPDHADPDTIVPSISYFRDERLRAFHLVAERCRFARGEGLPGRVYADGRPEWVNGQEALLSRIPIRRAAAEAAGLQAVMALPVHSGDSVIAVLELFSDQQHSRNDLLANLMNDMGAQIGKVLERERSTGEMADLAWRQQQALLHTLHDSLGQTLTGLGMLASGLKHRIEPDGAESAAQIGQLAQQAMEQVRQLSRGMFPIEIDAEALRPALHELATTTETFHGIQVTVDCAEPAPISDSRVATQLYRIAQEAVTNAVKHAGPTSIRIELRVARGVVILRVSDDGVGITGRASKGDGLGLRIMMHRATSIGASVVIEPTPTGGTVVACTLGLSSPAPVPPVAAPLQSS